MQLATICAVLVNAHRDPKTTNPASHEDFLLKPGTLEDHQREKTARMLDILRAVAKPGKPKRRKPKVPK